MPFDDDMSPVFPDKKIKCKDCVFRKDGKIGYKNAYCDMFPRGKPNEILFKNADCEYYQKEKASG